jgi:hypothetical protein
LQSRALFADLHPSLETDLYEAFVGDRLGKVLYISKCNNISNKRLI